MIIRPPHPGAKAFDLAPRRGRVPMDGPPDCARAELRLRLIGCPSRRGCSGWQTSARRACQPPGITRCGVCAYSRRDSDPQREPGLLPLKRGQEILVAGELLYASGRLVFLGLSLLGLPLRRPEPSLLSYFGVHFPILPFRVRDPPPSPHPQPSQRIGGLRDGSLGNPPGSDPRPPVSVIHESLAGPPSGWSSKRDLNPQPLDWRSSALPLSYWSRCGLSAGPSAESNAPRTTATFAWGLGCPVYLIGLPGRRCAGGCQPVGFARGPSRPGGPVNREHTRTPTKI